MAKKYRSFGEIEEVSRRLRSQLHINHLERPDLISLFENGLSSIYPGLCLIPVIDDELPECEAQADCYERTITVRDSVYQACLRGEPRASVGDTE
jgi:hypothetical protein